MLTWEIIVQLISVFLKVELKNIPASHKCDWHRKMHKDSQPTYSTYVRKLDRVQEFAAKVVTRKWSATGSDLVNQLGWPRLHLRRQLAKLCLCEKILSGESLIPTSVFEPHPSTSVRHANSKPLFLLRVHTDYHRGSYFVSTVLLWNSIPDRILTSTSRRSFKFH